VKATITTTLPPLVHTAMAKIDIHDVAAASLQEMSG
jgi:hypothetical protein